MIKQYYSREIGDPPQKSKPNEFVDEDITIRKNESFEKLQRN